VIVVLVQNNVKTILMIITGQDWLRTVSRTAQGGLILLQADNVVIL
jgi:hypothetical protein